MARPDPERAWVTRYGAWVHSVDVRIEDGRPIIDACREFQAVPDPPDEFTEPAERVHDACVALAQQWADLTLTQWYDAEGALRRRLFWHRSLPRRSGIVESSRIEPRLSALASELSEREVEVRCWSDADWPDVESAWRAFAGKPDFWLYGLAEFYVNRVQLAPAVCGPWALFMYSSFAPAENDQAYRLAEAVATLTHEARHLKHPSASEAVVECYGLQDMRELLISLGHSRRYANHLIAFALELSYPQLPPEYRTRRCRAGGPLDLTPGDGVWP